MFSCVSWLEHSLRCEFISSSAAGLSPPLPLLAAEVNERRLSVVKQRPHCATLGIGLDQELPRRFVAKPLDLAVGPGQDEEALGFVVHKAESRGRRLEAGRVGRGDRSIVTFDFVDLAEARSIVVGIRRPGLGTWLGRAGTREIDFLEQMICDDEPRPVGGQQTAYRTSPPRLNGPIRRV